jgi:hypothetical protein
MPTASRAKAKLITQLTGSLERGFQTLPNYLDRLAEANPGTVWYHHRDNDDRFLRAGLCLPQMQVSTHSHF